MAAALAVIGVLCLLYGVCVMLIGSGTWFFAFWYALGAALLAGAWCVHVGVWAAVPPVARRVVQVALGVLLACFAVTLGLQAKDFGDRAPDGVDCIVVLGAQVRDQGPSTVLQFRLDAACDYLRRNPETMCIVSGGQGPNEPATEADVMADYLIARGVDPNRIMRERKSTNTVQNIAFSAQMLDPARDSVAIVTNDFHVFRSVALARKAGFADVHGLAARSAPFYLPNNMVRESLGLAKDFLQGNF